jgi:hypothetical protein
MHNVFANMWQVAAKAGMNKSIARFPDVCLSPPSPPAGPIPIPYPDTAFSSDLKDGSSTVKIAGKPVALAQKSFYKPSVLGNEAATRSFGANVITHQITGKTVFQAWSMDVKVEGKNVCRHIDITTSNHASDPAGEAVPAPTVEGATSATSAKPDPCPCCGDQNCAAALPAMVKTKDGGEVARPKMSFETYFQLDEEVDGKPTQRAQARRKIINDKKCTGGDCPTGGRSPPKSDPPCDVYRPTTVAEKNKIEEQYNDQKENMRQARGIPVGVEWTQSHYDLLGVSENKYRAMSQNQRQKLVQLDHTTPKAAGGCPTADGNVTAHAKKCSNCQEIDSILDDNWHASRIKELRNALNI